jgi:hypothetical protein
MRPIDSGAGSRSGFLGAWRWLEDARYSPWTSTHDLAELLFPDPQPRPSGAGPSRRRSRRVRSWSMHSALRHARLTPGPGAPVPLRTPERQPPTLSLESPRTAYAWRTLRHVFGIVVPRDRQSRRPGRHRDLRVRPCGGRHGAKAGSARVAVAHVSAWARRLRRSWPSTGIAKHGNQILNKSLDRVT